MMSRLQRDDSIFAALSILSFININIIIIIIMIFLTNIINCAYSINELCPGRCKCEDEFLRAACISTSLEVVPIQLNPEIQHLDLSNNRIGSLTLAFGFYDNLESLDLSSNVICTLGSENFLLQRRLIKLNISNNKIQTISKSALKGLENLTVIDLSDNNITDMDSQTFHYTNKLQDVDLSGNSLISLPDGLLKNLPQIKTLKLQHNSLLQVPKSNLELAPSLQLLDLSDNLILEIEYNSIPFLRSLVTLNLANNIIKNISNSAFERLPALLYLNIEGNNLTIVPTNSFARLSVLSHLILSRNPLKTLNSLAFRNLFELETLDLRQTNLNFIDERAFADNINLKKIFLDNNHQLQYLPPHVLYNARYLKTISLRHCKLSTLQPTQFPVDNLKNLQIGGNPFVCNCSLHWLWNIIHTEKQKNITNLWLDSNEIMCNDSEFHGKLLTDLTETSLKCQLSTLYLTILATGCLTATAILLALIAWVTHNERKKRLPFVPPNHPELLVFVGSNQNIAEKNSIKEQYSRNKLLTKPNHQQLHNLTEYKNNINYQSKSNSSCSYKMSADCYQCPVTDSNVLHNDTTNCQIQMSFPSGSNSNYDFDYESNHKDIFINNQRPHVVFV